MKFNDKELEELITYAEQLKVLAPRTVYNEQLIRDLFNNMKNKTKVSEENLKYIQNNYIILDIIGLGNCNKKLRERIDEYLDY